jgi:hypothetical protein
MDGGWVGRLIPGMVGAQCFGFDISKKKYVDGKFKRSDIDCFLWDSSGNLIKKVPEIWRGSFPAFWDCDQFREVITIYGDILKHDGKNIKNLGNGVIWAADLFGDHREEIVSAPGGNMVYVYTNTDESYCKPRITRIADRQYSNDLSRTAMQINVVPTEDGVIPFSKGTMTKFEGN